MKNTNKLVSFICSLALVSSTFTGIIVANADDTDSGITQGIELVYQRDDSSTNKAYIDVVARGIESVESFQVTFELPEGVVLVPDSTDAVTKGLFKSNTTMPTVQVTYNPDTSLYTLQGYASGSATYHDATADPVMATIILPLESELENDMTLTLSGDSAITGYNGEEYVTLYNGDEEFPLPVASVTVLADPHAPTNPPTEPPTPTPEATAAPVVTEKPGYVETPAPTDEPVVITQGIELIYQRDDSSANKAYIDVAARGIESVESFQVTFELPEGVVLVPDSTDAVTKGLFKSNTTMPTVQVTYNPDTSLYTLQGYASGSATYHDATADPVMATIILPLESELENDMTLTLSGDSAITGYNGEEYVTLYNGDEEFPLPVASVTVLADPTAEEPAEPTPFPTDEPEKKASEIATNASEYPSEYDGKQLNGLTVTATTTSGDATYGEDYVAYYDGEELTEAEFSNLINGYNDGVTVDDMINNLSFRANKGVSISIAPAYMDDTTKTTLPGYEQTYENALPATPSPAATAAPTAAPTSTPSGGNQGGNQGGNSGNNNNNNNNNGGNGSGQIARPGTSVTTPGGNVTTVNFQDLDSVPWAKDAINALASSGLINGRSSTVFDPNATVTRAEFTKMICSAFGIASTPNASQTFTDVSPSDWYYGWVQAAVSYGIVNGVSDTAFDPNATIKRQDMATIMYRAIQSFNMTSSLPSGTAKTFADYDQIDDYAKASVTALSSASVINGTSDTTFEPYATATRAQAACIIYQYYQAIGAM